MPGPACLGSTCSLEQLGSGVSGGGRCCLRPQPVLWLLPPPRILFPTQNKLTFVPVKQQGRRGGGGREKDEREGGRLQLEREGNIRQEKRDRVHEIAWKSWEKRAKEKERGGGWRARDLRPDGEGRLSNEAQAGTRVLHSSRVVAAEDCERTPRTAPPASPPHPHPREPSPTDLEAPAEQGTSPQAPL